jgi:tetratricopeptide (TPR) repeat protein
VKIHQRIAAFFCDTLAKTYLNWSLTQIQKDEPQKALISARRALRLNSSLTGAFVQRGRASYRLGDYHAALADYDIAIAQQPKWADVFINRGLVYYALGNIDDAFGDFNWAIYLNPRLPLAYNHRGMADEALGNLSGAIADYTQAIQLDPRLTVVYTNRARARLHKGDRTGALRDFQQYLALGGGWLNGDREAVEALVRQLSSA